ncbi:hypothetical protein [Alkalihalobacillus sp. CinArs1]|uniref:hypothetical protein n=1 Tax=Alkalihalobacillus sp. CinArs1 TaxID=2995314 RepID=UPI0022DD6D54|nr:hypothetical protein [Alkalihalobacillus sp. CinArs1]
MFIRVHSVSDSQDHALAVLSKVLEPLSQHVISRHLIKSEQYWKIDMMFVTEAEVSLQDDFSREDLTVYLEKVSENWDVIENPLEAITSTQMGDISIENIAMITISFAE